MDRFYPIGTPGQPWTDDDRATWLAQQEIRRSYQTEVRDALEALGPPWRVERYGALSHDPVRYPLLCAQPVTSDPSRPWALITGGVHGYETSGVQGALAFLIEHAAHYLDRVNVLVAPCVSPWGYEVINRWNPQAVDPNRSFVADGPSEEATALMALVAKIGGPWRLHIDLHETTDSDEGEFRPALAARDGRGFTPGTIPDGFYTVADTENPQPDLQRAIVQAVEKVTHIAPPDASGRIIGEAVTQPGVIHYAFKKLGLCAGVTDAPYTSTTEVYPDSPRATPAQCNAAQVAAVKAALDHALS